MEKDFLTEADDVCIPYVCPKCGKTEYVWGDVTIICDTCDTEMKQANESDLMHYDKDYDGPAVLKGEPDPDWDVIDLPHIRNKIRRKEGMQNSGIPVYLSVCPDCGGYRWSKQGKGVAFCNHCKNNRVLIDTFVL